MTSRSSAFRVTAAILSTTALAVSCAQPKVAAAGGSEAETVLSVASTSSSPLATSTVAIPATSFANSTSISAETSVVGDGFTAVAHRLEAVVRFGEAITLSPPEITDAPALSAQATYDKLVSSEDLSALEFKSKVINVQLARFSNTDAGAIQPDGSVKPFWINKLVWTFSYDEVRGYQGGAPAPGQPTRPLFVQNTRILIVADPTTGREVMEKDIGI